MSELTFISRNGRDQMNSSAALRMAARVRSDFVAPGAGCSTARNGYEGRCISDMVSDINDTVSVVKEGKYLGCSFSR